VAEFAASFCHEHEDYSSRLTREFTKENLELYPLVIQPFRTYHKALILSVMPKNRGTEFSECLKQDSGIISFEQCRFWDLPDVLVAHIQPYDKYELRLVTLMISHENKPCISKFCYNHSIPFNYHCIKEGKDYFSFKIRLSESRMKYLIQELGKIGNLCNDDDDLRTMEQLISETGTADSFGRMLFFIMEKFGIDDDDIRVYLKARSSNLSHDLSTDAFMKCAYSLNMHPNQFRKRYWSVSKTISLFISNLCAVLVRSNQTSDLQNLNSYLRDK
jgi:hypothetical protein